MGKNLFVESCTFKWNLFRRVEQQAEEHLTLWTHLLWYFKGKVVNFYLQCLWCKFLQVLWETSFSIKVWSYGPVDPPGKPVKCPLCYWGKCLWVSTCTEVSASPPGGGLILDKVFRDLALVVTSRWAGGRGGSNDEEIDIMADWRLLQWHDNTT